METSNKYPSHLYDPERREIAIRYIRHELRKLFPNIRDKEEWKLLDSEVAKWWNENPTLSPVRDFWNGLHGISMGFKLKNIVSLITSEHLDWSERQVPIHELFFGSPIGIVKEVKENYSAQSVQKWLSQPERAVVLEEERQRSLKEEKTTSPRDQYPAIAVRKDGHLVIIDGNRRLLRAIVNKKQELLCVVGEPNAQPYIYNAWVPTSSLCELVSCHRYWSSLGRDTTDAVAQVIAELIRDSVAGQVEFTERALRNNEVDNRLKQTVQTILEGKTRPGRF